MGVPLKNKIKGYMSSKLLLFLILFYFLFINLQILYNADVFRGVDIYLNIQIKYGVLFNTIVLASSTIGAIIAIFLGSNILTGDEINGSIYIILNLNPNRKKYLMVSYLAIIIIILSVCLIAISNLILFMYLLKINIIFKDICFLFTNIFFNMLIISIISGLFSLLVNRNTGILFGIFSLFLFNIHSYNQIPFTNFSMDLSLNLRKLLFYISPLSDILAPSLDTNKEIYRLIPLYKSINYTNLYRLFYTLAVQCISIKIFKHKDI